MQTGSDGNIVGEVRNFGFALFVVMLLALKVQDIVIVGPLGDDITMQEKTLFQSNIIGVPGEPWLLLGILLQTLDKPWMAVVIAQDEVKIAA